MTVRVLSGEFRSRRLQFPRDRAIRPALARIKKMIFDTLGNDLRGLRVLDLFAGSGSLGIEALSLGAEQVTFVDNHHSAIKTIESNVASLGLQKRARILFLDALKALGRLEREGAKFAVVFVDPPYNQGLARKTLMALDRSDILPPRGRLVTEYSRQEGLPTLRSLTVERTRRFGITCLSFLYRRSNS